MTQHYVKKDSFYKISQRSQVAVFMALLMLAISQISAQNIGPATRQVHTPSCVYKIDPNKELRPKREVPATIKAKIANNDTPCSTIIVNYIGFGSNPEAQVAFQYAVDIWSHSIESSWEIRINANFTDLGESVGGSITLGSAGPTGVSTDNPAQNTPGVDKNFWYAQALYEKLTGQDTSITEDSVDISASFNSNEDVNWYYGTDANPPNGTTDFVSVVLHEIGHGLGFIGLSSVDEGVTPNTGSVIFSGRPHVYSDFIETGEDTALLTLSDDSADMYDALTGNDLFCNSPETVTANGGSPAKIYAPGSYNPGSSYSHWDEATYEGDDDNNLMTPTYDGANHNPGNITLAFFQDMGWGLCESLTTEEFTADNFGISPVPFTNQIQIRVPVSVRFDQLEMTLYDITGKIIHQKSEAAMDNIISLDNLEQLESNIYLLRIRNTNTNQTITKKIIKG